MKIHDNIWKLIKNQENLSSSSFLLTSSLFHFPSSLTFLLFSIFSLPLSRPGGMRGAIEYGQPLLQPCGNTEQKPSEIRSVSASAKRSMRPSRLPPGPLRATSGPPPGQPSPTLVLLRKVCCFNTFCYILLIYPAYILPISCRNPVAILPISCLNPA